MEYLDISIRNVLTTISSDRLWQRLGYTLLGVVPKVARLKGIEVQLPALKLCIYICLYRGWWMRNNITTTSQL